MNNLTSYTIIDGANLSQLIVRVNKAIQEGWKPIGGVTTSESSNYFYQAMVRIESANSED